VDSNFAEFLKVMFSGSDKPLEASAASISAAETVISEAVKDTLIRRGIGAL
jgi:hypothetical protein